MRGKEDAVWTNMTQNNIQLVFSNQNTKKKKKRVEKRFHIGGDIIFPIKKYKTKQIRKSPNLPVKKLLPCTEISSGEVQRSLLYPHNMKLVSPEYPPAEWEQHIEIWDPPPPWVFLEISHPRIRFVNVTSARPKNVSENAEYDVLGPLIMAEHLSACKSQPA